MPMGDDCRDMPTLLARLLLNGGTTAEYASEQNVLACGGPRGAARRNANPGGKMRKRYGRGTAVLGVVVGLLLVRCAWGGSLVQTNAPGPTMHTLEEIYQKLEWIGTNMVRLVVTTNTSTRPQQTGQTASYHTGDDGDLRKGVRWPSPRFTVNAASNTVFDSLTGLMWARNGNIWGSVTWNTAVDNCNSLELGGYTDWRLPNLRELHSLVDYSRYTPAVPAAHPFTNVHPEYYWSSTTFDGGPVNAWGVYFGFGYVALNDKTSVGYAWPVRDEK